MITSQNLKYVFYACLVIVFSLLFRGIWGLTGNENNLQEQQRYNGLYGSTLYFQVLQVTLKDSSKVIDRYEATEDKQTESSIFSNYSVEYGYEYPNNYTLNILEKTKNANGEQNYFPCPPQYCELDGKVLQFKELGFEPWYAFLWALILCFCLGLCVRYRRLGDLNIFIAVTLLCSLRFFMSISETLFQSQYANLITLTSLELMIIPIMAATLVQSSVVNTRQYHSSKIDYLIILGLPIFLFLFWYRFFCVSDVSVKLSDKSSIAETRNHITNVVHYVTSVYFNEFISSVIHFNGFKSIKHPSYFAEFIFIFGLFFFNFIVNVIYKNIFKETITIIVALLITVTLMCSGLSQLAAKEDGSGLKAIPYAALLILLLPFVSIIFKYWGEGMLKNAKKINIVIVVTFLLLVLGALFYDSGAVVVLLVACLAICLVFELNGRGNIEYVNKTKLLKYTRLTFRIGFVVLGLIVLIPLVTKYYFIGKMEPYYMSSKNDHIEDRNIIKTPENSWLLETLNPCVLPDKSRLEPADINRLDTCFKTYFTENRTSRVRIYSWLIGQPFDRIWSPQTYGYLGGGEQARANSIPNNTWLGDKVVPQPDNLGFITGEKNGFMYEHAAGLFLIKPLGLIAGIAFWMALIYLYISIPRDNQGAKIYVAIIGFISVWLILQTQGVFPVIGQSLPFMTISSFSKDFFPMVCGLLIYLYFPLTPNIFRRN